jgi:hypothetical protein
MKGKPPGSDGPIIIELPMKSGKIARAIAAQKNRDEINNGLFFATNVMPIKRQNDAIRIPLNA